MATFQGLLISLCLGALAACAAQSPATSPAPSLSAAQRFGDRPGITLLATVPDAPVQGQTVYVPVYSEVFDSESNRAFQLAATLSLRNTDRAQPIVIDTIDYYNSGGDRIVAYLDQPIQLGPLASTEVVVNRSNVAGGAGANFIVEWQAATPVSEPIIEAVMISTASQQGVSFVTTGRVIETLRP
jgi:hypothetical protein